MLVYDFLNDRTHGITTVHDATFLHLFVDKGNFDIFQVCHTSYLVLFMQHLQQSTMYRCEHHAALQRSADNGSVRQVCRQFFISRHYHIFMQHLIFPPRILQGCNRITFVAHHRQFSCILESNGVTTVLLCSSLSATRR